MSPITKQLTAKANLRSYRNKVMHEWVSGKSYTATFHKGEIHLEAENGKHIFNGIRQEEVYDNFIFWGE